MTTNMQAPGTLALSHVEFFAEDADAMAGTLAGQYRLKVLARRSDGSGTSLVLGAGRVRVVVTDGPPGSRPAEYVRSHGAGLADIALATPDAAGAYAAAVAAGGRGLAAPVTKDDVTTATIAGFGDTVHTFVQAPENVLPGFGALEAAPASPVGITRIDHLAVCLPTGDLGEAVGGYERALGFRTIFSERIVVGDQAMDSQVVQAPGGDVTMTLIQPDPDSTPGQINRFLKDHGGPGVQHLAFACEDIVRCTGELSRTGVEFLATPPAYYRRLTDRMHLSAHSVAELRRLNILADEDHDGQLFQIFTRSTHPRATFFVELIERLGARTFGSGNIRALYEAVEADEDGQRPGR